MSNDNPAPKRSSGELRRDIEHTRRELAETLDALEYKLDVPARFGEWLDERKTQLRKATDESPATVIGVAASAVVLIGGIIAGVVGLARRGR
ncbi:DUF3618 domain-containing protein [Gulosibacter molinativorax]|uniref:DUF3618 domain-containing protein n=1 Tax=Gulosibacter molinativorax TaxID=256821 RepID=A0ABT7C6B8_9MICO|nr:DUF3618 domain-containing protein [Gulosibacter molinativorax]MDJ1370714.1 DUF3618 domain-containing protein [Gulosibacter molinativorax]QUY63260.1 Hypotetical protein [Gulosibacter molinativorax]